MLAFRFGAKTYGLVDYPDYGLRRLGAAGFDLPLPHGRWFDAVRRRTHCLLRHYERESVFARVDRSLQTDARQSRVS